MIRGDGFSARGKLVDHRYIQISVEGHGEVRGMGVAVMTSMWGNRVLLPEFGSLGDTETMLLVDNNKSHVLKFTTFSNKACVPIRTCRRPSDRAFSE